MYLQRLKTLLVEALKETFDEEYVDENFRQLKAGIEFPVSEQDYPGIWVNYTDVDKLRVAGISHVEHTDPDTQSNVSPFTRWKFGGTASFTVVALSSSERDALYDELVRVLAFGREQPETSRFRHRIENNDLLAVNIDFDEIEVSGSSAAPGTPWGTGEFIYEVTVTIEVIGEFVADRLAAVLVPLSKIVVTPTESLPEVGDLFGSMEEIPVGPGEGASDWH